MHKIFIVEDDLTISTLVRENLERWGFRAVCAKDFGDICGEVRREKPQLILLDVSLPFYDGFFWCFELRKETSAPIIFLSSHAESMDIVMAVSMGADDYITKPFSIEVLVAKVKAVLRRAYSYSDEPSVLECRGALLNIGDGTIEIAGSTLELTKNEQRILKLLFERKNRIASRDDMMKALWNSECFIDDNTLTVNINRLRAKLSDAGLDDFIVTKKGEGYMIND